MNYSDKFGATSFQEISSPLNKGGFDFSIPGNTAAQQAPSGFVKINDAELLFSGTYKREGSDLVISNDVRKLIVPDYFKGEARPTLTSRDGATLSGKIVEALTGHVNYAQAAGTPEPPKEIGSVVKLTGSATAIRNGVAVELKIGDKVYKGDVIQSGQGSSLGISFIDGTAFSLSSNARMVLNEMVYDPNGTSNSSLLSLVQGTITFVAGQTAKNGNMRVDTPVATMGIRGTAVLVEIGADNGPTKFSVLVEPGNKVGTFNLYDKTTGSLLGTVSQAGQVTLVTPAGIGQQATAVEIPKTNADFAAEKQLIQQVFQIFFPNYNDANPQGTKTGGSSVNNLATLIDQAGKVNPGTTLLDTKVNVPGSSGPVSVTVTASTSPPPIVITNVADIQPPEEKGGEFDIGAQIRPDSRIIPYIAGSGKLDTAEGPESMPSGFPLRGLVTLDAQTGRVTYNPADFRFLADGEQAIYTFSFQTQADEFIFTKTLTLTIDGLNDAPIFTVENFASPINESLTTDSNSTFSKQSTLTFNDADFSDVSSGYTVQTLGVTATGTTTAVPNAATLLGFLHFNSVVKAVGSTQGVITETFTAPESAFDYLAAGETVNLAYRIRVTDEDGASRIATLNVTVTGTNDAPTITGATTPCSTSGDLTEDGVLTASGVITFRDVDLSNSHNAVASHLPTSGSISSPLPGFNPATSSLGSLVVTVNENTADANNIGTVSWVYSLDNLVAQRLAEGQVVTQTFTVTITDSSGATVTQPVTVTIAGTNDVPEVVLSQVTLGDDSIVLTNVAGAITEPLAVDAGAASAEGIVVFKDVDLIDTHTASFVEKSSNAAADLPGFNEGLGTADEGVSYIGTFTLGNINESATDLIDLGAVGWTFTIDNDDPTLQSLAEGQTITQVYTITITDSSNSHATVSKDVTVTITGTNDAPVIDAVVDQPLGEQTDNKPLTATIGVTFTDVDLIDVGHTATVTDVDVTGVKSGLALDDLGLIGLLTPGAVTKTGTSADGSFDLHFSAPAGTFDYLADGEELTLVYTVTVDDGDTDGVSTQTVTIVITGTNDLPVVATTDVTGGVEELVTPAGNLTDTGDIAFTDVDLSDIHEVTVAPSSNLGTLTATITTDTTTTGTGGLITWNYSVAAADVEYLAADETRVETFTITLDDGNGGLVSRTIEVTITGTNDAPTIATIANTTIGEETANGPLNTTINVTFADIDLTDVGHSAAITAVAATGAIDGLALTPAQLISLVTIPFVTKASGSDHGAVTLGFSAGPATPGAFNYLADGETLTLTYTLEVSDGDGGSASQTFVLNITGTNDAPMLTVVASTDLTSVTEDEVSNAGQTVASFIGTGITDADHNAIEGIAITGSNAQNGHWEFSIDGGAHWSQFGTYSNGQALLLAADDKVRFVPNAENGGVSNFSFVAWDQTAGTHGDVVNASVAGDSTAFSTQSSMARIEVTSLNDAPVISAIDPTDLEDPSDTSNLNASITVSYTDVDVLDTGHTAAVTNATATGAIDGLTLTEPQLIGLISIPGGGGGSFNPQFSAASSVFDYLADGDVLTLTYTIEIDDGDGGVTPKDFVITIAGTNDAPTISAASLVAVNEDVTDPAGQSVADLFAASFTDPDTGASFAGIAVIGDASNASQGVWQYKSPGGVWEDIGTVSPDAALAFTPDTKLRFVPAPDFNGTPGALQVYGLDDTYDEDFTLGAGQPGGRYTINTTDTGDEPLGHGGSSPVSADAVALSTSVTSVNDAPALDLDPEDVTEAGSGYSVNLLNDGQFTTPIAVMPAIADVDSTTMVAATVVLTDGQAGDYFFVPDHSGLGDGSFGALASGITWTITGTAGDVEFPLIITFTGAFSASAYADAIQQVSFGTASGAAAGDRHIDVIVNDGHDNSNAATATVHVQDAVPPAVAGNDTLTILGEANIGAVLTSYAYNDGVPGSFEVISGEDINNNSAGPVDGVITLAGSFGTLLLVTETQPVVSLGTFSIGNVDFPVLEGTYIYVLGIDADGNSMPHTPISLLLPGDPDLVDIFHYTIENDLGDESTAQITVTYDLNPLDMNVRTNSGYDTRSLWADIHDSFITEIDDSHIRLEVRANGEETGAVLKVIVIDAVGLMTEPANPTAPFGDEIALVGGTITGVHVFDASGTVPLLDFTNLNMHATIDQRRPGFYEAVGPAGSSEAFVELFQYRAFDVHGGAGVDVLYGGLFNDRIDTGGNPAVEGGDTVFAGGGNDLILIHDDNNWGINGGEGIDTVRFVGEIHTGQGSGNSTASSIEVIDLNTTHADTLLIDGEGAANINEDDKLHVLGNASDLVNFENSDAYPDYYWHQVTSDEDGYRLYEFVAGTEPGDEPAASVYVQNAVGVNFAPVIDADHIFVQELGYSVSTVFDLKIYDDDDASNLTVTTMAMHGTLNPPGIVGTEQEINEELSFVDGTGVTYTPTTLEPIDIVTVAVTDRHGLRDELSFVFNQSGPGGVTLVGTGGKDLIFSSDGNDEMWGDPRPEDSWYGQTGRDNFVFAPDNGQDTIMDFQSGIDRIDLRQFAGEVDADTIDDWLVNHASPSGTDTLIAFDANNSILVKHVAHLSANDFILHPGGQVI